MASRIIIHLFLLSLAVITGQWAWLQYNATSTHVSHHDLPHIVIHQATLIQMDKAGNVLHKLLATQLTHYPKNEYSDFDMPHFIIYGKDKFPWDITAIHGRLYKKNNQLSLWDLVKLQQQEKNTSASLLITTSKLDYFPEQEFAVTDKPITMSDPTGVIQSIGMRAYLKKHRIDLLAKTEGNYVQSQSG